MKMGRRTELEFRVTFDTMENKNPIATAPIVLAIFFSKSNDNNNRSQPTNPIFIKA